MGKKMLLVVPHQDDEIFVGGGLLRIFSKSKDYEVHVVFTTNGDFFPSEGEIRLRESLRVLTKLYVIPEKNISFLGYGDGWQGGKHLYNLQRTQMTTSICGRRETYGITEHEDYRWIKSGRHSVYCRDNFKADMKELMSDIMADIIIAVDYDKHPDHKAASLMAEECIGELLKEHPNYRPIVLKRYAYDGVWKGKADFFDLPRKRTILSQFEEAPYLEEDKICIGMPAECSTPYLRHNFLYIAAKCYKTQEVWQKADEIINIDEVYWRRNTNNLLYEAELKASSGQVEFIRDFKLYDCDDIMKKQFVMKQCAWLPVVSDHDRRIHIHFNHPQTIEQINIYALGNPSKDRLSGEFVLDNGVRLFTGNICLNGKKNKFTLERQSNIINIDFYITDCVGNPAGITEMEILPQRDGSVPEELQKFVFREDSFEFNTVHKLGMQIERTMFSLKRKLYRWFPNEFFLKRYYPELGKKRQWLFIYRIKFVWERVNSKFGNP
ncbi:MAG: PIG-L family deacetylase [Lachnospiraceae bacterium]|nr:PIG-L family deacetylase [Lachnospiraceae bacterium]